MRRRISRAGGFSLVEVLAAMMILSISLIVLTESQGRSMDLVFRSQRLDTATALASFKMEEIVQEAKTKGIDSIKDEGKGDFDQEKHPGFSWRYIVKPVPAPNFAALMGAASGDEEQGASNAGLLAGPLQTIGKMWGQSLRELHVEVVWQDGKREQSYELVTHVIAADVMSQISGLVSSFQALGGAK